MGSLLKETPHSEITANLEVLVARLHSDKDYARRVAEAMLRDNIDGSVHHELARATMGQNFFGIEEWATLYGANFSEEQLREVNKFPWGEDVLNGPCPFNEGKAVRETHFAFLGLEKLNADPLTILKWQELHPAHLTFSQPRFASYAPGSWYSSRQTFATKTAKLRWYLLLANIVPNSTDTAWDEQLAMLTDLTNDYEVPRAIEEVSKNILAYRKTGAYLNPKVFARVSNWSWRGLGIYVGCSDSMLRISHDGGGGWFNIGVSASRKLPRTLNT